MKSLPLLHRARYLTFALALVCLCPGHPAKATDMGTAFTYQGRLTIITDKLAHPPGLAGKSEKLSPELSGLYDLSFSLFDAASEGHRVGPALTNNGVAISEGLFAVTLDFGDAAFTGEPRWLEIGVRTNGGSTFTTLSPRQWVGPTPYALAAEHLVGSLPASQLSGLYSNAVSFTNPASSFVGNGTGLVGVCAASLQGLGASAFWQLGGNACTTAGMNFLGTTDNQPLELRANNQRVLRFEPVGPERQSPNVIAGDSANKMANASGSVVAGGAGNSIGSPPDSLPFGTFAATIGGGTSNVISAKNEGGTISGGRGNRLEGFGDWTTISGGESNRITDGYVDGSSTGSTISGGIANTVFLAAYAVIGGGWGNLVDQHSTGIISGGTRNYVGELNYAATIGGGEHNKVEAYAEDAVIAGGAYNSIAFASVFAAIGGGETNYIERGSWSTISGGGQNTINYASSCVIAGGAENSITGQTRYPYGFYSAIAGGQSNSIRGSFATIAGGQGNFATNNAFAAGTHASAFWPGSFVWADASSSNTFAALAPNQVSFRCAGGVLFSSGSSADPAPVGASPATGT